MLHKLSINKKWQDKQEKPGEQEFFPWTQFTKEFEIVEDLTVDDIAELCRRNTPLCNPFNQIPVPGEKTAKHDVNFVQYSFFQEDIDGTFNVEELLNDPFVQQYGTLILSSFNNSEHDPRGKVLYFSEEPITNIAKAKTFAKAMLKKRKEITAPDAKTKDPLRFCFTCNPSTAEVHVLRNLMPTSVVDAIIAEYEQWLAELKEVASKQRSYANTNADVFSEDGAYSHSMSNAWDYFNARIDLSTLPEVFGYTPCGENRWTRPDGNNPGGLVLIEDEFYYSHSANDPVYQLLESLEFSRPDCFSPFFMIAALKYGGDFKKAYAEEVEYPYRMYELTESPFARGWFAFLDELSKLPKGSTSEEQSQKANDSTQRDFKKEAKEARANQGAYIEKKLKSLTEQGSGKSAFDLLRWNEEEKRIYLGNEALEDHTSNIIYASFVYSSFTPSREKIDTVMEELANRKSFSPIHDYVTQSKWDGTPRIRNFARTYLQDDNKMIEYDDGSSELARGVFFEKWMVGAVARVLTKGTWQNPVLVMLGLQGKGKSSFASWLCSGIGEKYFAEIAIDPDNKDHQIATATHFIIELRELGAVTKRRDTEALKGFFTTKKFHLRPAYARHASDFYNTSSFIGTVNNSGPFLNDPTGNRRFLVLNMKSIDLKYENEDVDQLWAEAVHLYRNGYNYALTPEEVQLRDDVNDLHNTHLLMEDVVQDFCTVDLESDAFTPSRVLTEAFLELKICRNKSPDFVSKDICTALSKVGVEPERKRIFDNGVYKQVRGYKGVTLNREALDDYLREEHELQQARYSTKNI